MSTLVFAVFVFSGGCALFPAMDCLFSPRCDPFVGLFIIPGIFIAFLSAAIFLKAIKHSRLPLRFVSALYNIVGGTMLFVIFALAYFFFKEISDSNGMNWEAVPIIIGYLGVHALLAFITIRASVIMLSEPYKDLPQKIRKNFVFNDLVKAYSALLFNIFLFGSMWYFMVLQTRKSKLYHEYDFSFWGLVPAKYNNLVLYGAAPVIVCFLLHGFCMYLKRRMLRMDPNGKLKEDTGRHNEQ